MIFTYIFFSLVFDAQIEIPIKYNHALNNPHWVTLPIYFYLYLKFEFDTTD